MADRRRTRTERIAAAAIAVVVIVMITLCAFYADALQDGIDADGGVFMADVEAWARYEISASEVTP